MGERAYRGSGVGSGPRLYGYTHTLASGISLSQCTWVGTQGNSFRDFHAKRNYHSGH